MPELSEGTKTTLLLCGVFSPDEPVAPLSAGEFDRLIDEQLTRVRAHLKSMRALEKQLGSLRTRCHAEHTTAECGILHELVAAAHGEACACHHDSPPNAGASKSMRSKQ